MFTISLDFELHWGGFEKWPLQVAGRKLQDAGGGQDAGGKLQVAGGKFQVAGSVQVAGSRSQVSGGLGASEVTFLPVDKSDYKNYFLNTRQVIPELLHLFESHETHVTWATVGMLFHENKASLAKAFPEAKPTYVEKQLSAYEYINTKGIGDDEQSDPFHYAASLVKKILATKYQELGTHTFAHYYCNEAGQNVEQFRADLKAAAKSAEMYGVKLRSLVYPRNQFNEDYLRVCFEEGITSVRTNPLDWFWKIDSTQDESLWKRLNRGLDAYYPLGKKNTYKLESIKLREGFPIFIPASRLLRPYNPKEYFLNSMKIDRIKSEMTRAAKAGEVYHLWWHPHNFGHYPEQSLGGLRQILSHYDHCKTEFGMTSMNMGEIYDSVSSASDGK